MKGDLLRGSGLGGSVPSPCVRLCQLDPETRLCIGCRRTVQEIASWSFLSDPERQRVLDAVAQRRESPLAQVPSPNATPKDAE